jgi:hypothetical protein
LETVDDRMTWHSKADNAQASSSESDYSASNPIPPSIHSTQVFIELLPVSRKAKHTLNCYPIWVAQDLMKVLIESLSASPLPVSSNKTNKFTAET